MSRPQIFRLIFALAGVYNVAFGLWAVLAPRDLFERLRLGAPSHPAIWACVGMVVGLYGLVYFQIALSDPARTRSALVFGSRRVEYDFARFLVGVGLAGKLAGPIGFALAVSAGELPLRMLSLLVFNDFIWWTPFAVYLIDPTGAGAWIRRSTPRICAITHVFAAAATWAWIRGGSEAVADPSARAAYIAAHPVTWRAAWVVWMIAAAALVGFLAWWAVRADRPRLALSGLCVGFAGICADYFADALFIAWLPDLSTDVSSLATLVSEVIANGLYSLAGALLMLATPRLPPLVRAWGWAVWLSGFALAASRLLRVDVAIVAASAALLTLFIPWVWIAGRAIDQRA